MSFRSISCSYHAQKINEYEFSEQVSNGCIAGALATDLCHLPMTNDCMNLKKLTSILTTNLKLRFTLHYNYIIRTGAQPSHVFQLLRPWGNLSSFNSKNESRIRVLIIPNFFYCRASHESHLELKRARCNKIFFMIILAQEKAEEKNS